MRPSTGSRPLARSLLWLAVSLYACTGEQGPPGEPGQPGDPGDDGATALTRISEEPPGENCPDGGTKIEVGLDLDGDGVLDDEEVVQDNTTYVCDGTGASSLVETSAEPAGENCPFGGTRIETGLDEDGDGDLDAAEIDADATSYVCNVAPSGTISPSEGVIVAFKPDGVTTAAGAPISVRFTLKDERGFPLDLGGLYSVNTAMQPRFAIGYFTQDADGRVSPLTMYSKSASASAPAGQPTAYNPRGTSPGHGTLVENGYGAGDYTYTFPTASTSNGPFAVAYDPARRGETHVIWIQVGRQTDEVFTSNANTFYAANEPLYYVPDGSAEPVEREVVAQDKCDNCHAKFKAETTTSAQFHGGGRIAVGYCNACHNPGRTTNPDANSSVFVHRIHHGEMIAEDNLFHGIEAYFPRDIRDCNTCHGGAEHGDQALNNPSTAACKGCHDYVAFDSSAPAFCGIVGQLARDADGKPLPCNHVGGPVADNTCFTCHGPDAAFPVAKYHEPVAPPDPNNRWLNPAGSANTNASFIATGDFVPAGADVITYDIKSVDVVADAANASIKRPQITFKLKRNGVDVVFNTFAAGVTTELMPDFVGSPSVFFAWAVPQDGIAAPADYNASASGYIKKIWDGSATGTGAGTMTGPDGSGYYTIRLTGVQIASDATMVTGGVGYSYNLTSAPPLVQINVPNYPWIPESPANGEAQGGLSIPPPDVFKVATGFTGRRGIVDNAKCQNCHGKLGVAPTFHAGQRNDGPTCSFCHTPNRASSGWAAASKYFIHAIHAGRKRAVDFTWHALEAGPGFDEIEFPGTLNACTTCHLPNTFDFTNPTNLAAVERMNVTTVASGTFSADPLVNSTFFTLSPYITPGVNYGNGFSYSAATDVRTAASPDTLVLSPITGACSACHDSIIALDHMEANGGAFYLRRGDVVGGAQEQCMICHGPGRVAAIGEVHLR